MKSITKRLLALTAALAMTFSLAACGAPAQETETETAPATETTETTEEAPAEETAEPAEEATVGQSEETPAEDVAAIRVAALQGPTAIGMLSLMEKNDAQETANEYEFSLVASPEEMTSKILSGEVDIAAVPTNLAPVLYKKTEGSIQMAALNTMGVLYVVEKGGETISSVADLAGKTILSSGQGSVPEYAFNAILSQNGIDPATDVNIVYKTEHSEVAAALASGEATVAVLPQPFVSTVLSKQSDVRVALDLTEEWDKVYPESGLTMGCVVVQSDFAQQHTDALNAFLDEYRVSAEAAADPANLDHIAQLCADKELFTKEVALQAIPECNIVFKEGDEMKQIASGFFQVLYDANPQSVGGSLPDDGLYYQR